MSNVIFVGGSISVRTLPQIIESLLDTAMDNGAQFVVGDAPGVDTMVQRYLASAGYRNVTVYCMSSARNNVGAWATKTHRAPAGVTGGAWHAVKDRAMDQAATSGVMIWNGTSRGTLGNVVALLEAGKMCTIWDGKLRTFGSIDEFDACR